MNADTTLLINLAKLSLFYGLLILLKWDKQEEPGSGDGVPEARGHAEVLG
jgi:hypothetical protein